MTATATRKLIKQALGSTAAALQRSFAHADCDFWPATGNGDMAERHLTHHLASALAASGYEPYFEVAGKGMRLDLLLVRWRGQKAADVIAVEAKLLYLTNRHANGITRDIQRVAKWKPYRNSACLGENTPVHRLIVASLWCSEQGDKKYARDSRSLRDAWRSADTIEESFEGRKAWRRLANNARKRDAEFLQHKAAAYEGEHQTQHLLALLWE